MPNKASYETDKLPSIGIWEALKKNPFLSKLAGLLEPPDPVFINKKHRMRIYSLLGALKRSDKSLNVGSGSTRYAKDIVNFDLFKEPQVDIVGDSAFLPFKSGQFKIVICQAVLEHVQHPIQAVAEMHRVLAKGGLVYIEIPFFQGYHAVPNDFQRYTVSGIQNLFSQFELVEKGVLAGPASAIAWTLREFLAITFSLNNVFLYRVFNLIFGWLTFYVKYLDIFLERNRFSPVIASGFFFIGRK